MPLHRYRAREVIILSPMATTHEAARAMSRRHLGAVLVGQQGRIDGIVTDRDLALCVVGAGSDPKRTRLEEVMSYVWKTVDVSGTVDDVVDAMLEAASRRVPLAQNGKVVGIVTLDDLIADGAVSPDALASVVRTQLEVASMFRSDRGAAHESFDRTERARHRHERRAENTFLQLVNRVQKRTGLSTRLRAAAALGIVLEALIRRLSHADAKYLVAQLPLYLRATLLDEPALPDRAIDCTWVTDRIASELTTDLAYAETIVSAIGDVIDESVSIGGVHALRVRLPAGLGDLFPTRRESIARTA